MIPYSIFRVIIALVLGAVFYIMDRQGGTRLYRWWYGLTHEHPLQDGIHKGFVHDRGTKSRVVWAAVISSLIAIPAVAYSQHNALLEMALWLISIPVIVGAFMIGPRVWMLWGKRDSVYSAVDRWEHGDEMQAGPEPTKEKPAANSPAVEQMPLEEPLLQENVSSSPDPEVKAADDPQEMVNRFINRGKL